MRVACFAVPLIALWAGCRDRGDWPARCPNPSDPDVRYMHETWADRGICAAIDYTCEEDEEYIERLYEDCGCGCIRS